MSDREAGEIYACVDLDMEVSGGEADFANEDGELINSVTNESIGESSEEEIERIYESLNNNATRQSSEERERYEKLPNSKGEPQRGQQGQRSNKCNQSEEFDIGRKKNKHKQEEVMRNRKMKRRSQMSRQNFYCSWWTFWTKGMKRRLKN